MDPWKDLEQCDRETARAFVQLFEKCGDEFQFAVDGAAGDAEVRASIIDSARDYEGRSLISVTSINVEDNFKRIVETLEEMGLETDVEEMEKEDEYIGEYTAYVAEAFAPHNISAEWNVPHLVVYGSLTPEVEECILNAFSTSISYSDIRNHFIVYGEQLDEKAKTELTTAVQKSNEFFDEDKRAVVSDVRTSDFI